jgi:hypothetical protein
MLVTKVYLQSSISSTSHFGVEDFGFTKTYLSVTSQGIQMRIPVVSQQNEILLVAACGCKTALVATPAKVSY